MNNYFSYQTSVISGVPQGSVLGPLLFVLYINDLTSSVDSNVQILSFADDTKLLSKISSINDQNTLQKSLNSVIEWSNVNNMKLNSTKFELLSFNLDTNNPNKILLQELPFQTYLNVYFASDFLIAPSPLVRDLGVYIDEKLNWAGRYNILIQKAKKMCAWILGSMYSRDKEVLLVLFNALVRSKLEYCCEVWCPHLNKDIVSFEQIQRSFTNRISGQQGFNYWERLNHLKINSLQRRRETLIILHVWKIKNNHYPNTVFFEFKLNTRTNCMRALIKPLPKVKGKLLTKFEESFLVRACKLWNVLPANLTQITNLNLFKIQLERFLENIPDEPPLPGYPCLNSNSLLEQCSRVLHS